MRAIADELGISVGNLTYYFKFKEDLVEEVATHAFKEHTPPAVPRGLGSLHGYFVTLVSNEQTMAFYFSRLEEEIITDAVRKIRAELVTEFYATLSQGFANLESAGFIKREPFDGQRRLLFNAMRLVAAYPDGSTRKERLDLLWALVYPLFTIRGRRAFNKQTVYTIDD